MNRWWLRYFVFLLTVLAVSALVSPWVYWAVKSVASVKFHDVLNRCLLVSSLLGGFWILWSERVFSRQTLGLLTSPRARRDVVLGALVAMGSVAVLWIIGIASGSLVWTLDEPASQVVQVFVGNILAAVVVAVVEEVHFRGCLLGWLRLRTTASIALAVVTLHYALAHFLDPPKVAKRLEVDWLSGFRMLGFYVDKLSDNLGWFPQFALLVLIGATMGWCVLRTSRLYLAMGLHAGWVFAGKSLTFLTDESRTANWWFGYGKLIGSPITLLILMFVFVLMIWICRSPTMRNDLAR